MNKNMKWKVLLIVALMALSIWKVYPPKDKLSLGLDLQGGMYLVLKVDLSALDEKSRTDAVDRAVEIIRNRIDEFGVKEPDIIKEGKDRIVVQLPGVSDRERALALIGKTALLEFKVVDDNPDRLKAAAAGNIPEGYELKELDNIPLLVEKQASMNGNLLANAMMDFDSSKFGEPYVSLEFNPEGAKLFAKITAENVGKRLAIVLDGQIHSAPQVREPIPGGRAQITGGFTREQAADLSLILRAGALPAPISIEQEETIGASAGKDSVDSGFRAALFGSIAVFVFMLGYYFVSGLIADFALCLNLLFLMALMSLLNASITLPGIAGIALTLGMAVDANVLILERIREELGLGKQLRSAISAGYDRAFLTILDSNVTTLIASVLLFWFGTGPVKGFATTLSLGLIVGMFTSVFVTRVVFDWITKDKTVETLRMFKLIGTTTIDFIGTRKIAYICSLVVIIGGMSLFVARGQNNFGVEFTGGVVQQFSFDKNVDISAIRQSLKEIGLESERIQRLSNGNQYIIRTKNDYSAQIIKKFNESFKDMNCQMTRMEMIGPAVGNDLTQKAVWALFLAFIGMCIYISFRFEFKYSVAGIIALFHDVFVVLGAMAITGREISLPVVAAILALVGYSINDTIVIFDRIRENLKISKKATFAQTINLSINQTLSRTFLTSFTALLVTMSLFLFGGKGINDFAFAMLIGIITGTYSTVYTATAIVYDWPKKI